MRKNNGFTLIELVVAMMLLIVALVGIVGIYSKFTYDTELYGDRVVAALDAGDIMERMRDINSPALIVTQYPNGGQVPGFNNLQNEQITVAYADTGANPVEVAVTVNWITKGRAMNLVLTGTMTTR